MTLEEVTAHIGTRRMARIRGQVFFSVYDPDEAQRWRELGARVHTDTPGGHFVAEVHPWAMLDEPTETDDDGHLVDNRQAILYDFYADRDPTDVPRWLTRA